MKCPYCGTRDSLVWEESRGTVVCSECGTVVDSIYVSGGRPNHELEPLIRDRGSVTLRIFGKMSDPSVKYLAILREIKHKPLLYIDCDSFNRYLVLGKRIKVIRRRFSPPKSEVLDMLVRLMSKYPKLCSRTDRAKYAIAMIAYTIITEGSVDVPRLSKDLGLSKTHVRRLLRVVRSSQDFLNEVRRWLSVSLPR